MERLPLKIKPAKEVFSFAVRNESKTPDVTLADMDKVIERLTKDDLKPSFENIIMALAQEEGLNDRDMEILKEILEIAKGGI